MLEARVVLKLCSYCLPILFKKSIVRTLFLIYVYRNLSLVFVARIFITVLVIAICPVAFHVSGLGVGDAQACSRVSIGGGDDPP